MNAIQLLSKRIVDAARRAAPGRARPGLARIRRPAAPARRQSAQPG